MALREIREDGDETLRAVCKPIRIMTPRLRELIADMYDTMYEADGVGLAAPQVGVRKRLFVIDTGVDEENMDPVTMINPEIIAGFGEETDREGCLSLPGKCGLVTRPSHVLVRYLNEDMEEVILSAEGLKARAIQHELDHLDGVLYKDKVEGRLYDVSELEPPAEEADVPGEAADAQADPEAGDGMASGTEE